METYSKTGHHHKGIDEPRISYNDLTDTPASGWDLLASIKLTAADAVLIDTDVSTDYDMFRIAIHGIAPSGSNIAAYIQFNSDTGTNYDFTRARVASSQVINADSAASYILFQYGAIAAGETITTSCSIGKAAADKHAKVILHSSYYDVDISSIARSDVAGTWRNTSSKISNILIATTANQFDTNSIAIIEGYKG